MMIIFIKTGSGLPYREHSNRRRCCFLFSLPAQECKALAQSAAGIAAKINKQHLAAGWLERSLAKLAHSACGLPLAVLFALMLLVAFPWRLYSVARTWNKLRESRRVVDESTAAATAAGGGMTPRSPRTPRTPRTPRETPRGGGGGGTTPRGTPRGQGQKDGDVSLTVLEMTKLADERASPVDASTAVVGDEGGSGGGHRRELLAALRWIACLLATVV